MKIDEYLDSLHKAIVVGNAATARQLMDEWALNLSPEMDENQTIQHQDMGHYLAMLAGE